MMIRGALGLGGAALIVMFIAGAAHAQSDLSFPPLPISQLDSLGRRETPAPLGTPAELWRDVELARALAGDAYSDTSAINWDLVSQRATVGRARTWLNAMPVAQGRQLEAAMRLALAAQRDTLAKRYLVTRLTASGLSFAERTAMLFAAAMAFADRSHPERLPDAESYLVQLRTLGVTTAPQQLLVHHQLVLVYGALGQAGALWEHALAMATLAGTIPFEYRAPAFDVETYLLLANTAGTNPTDRARLAQFDTLLHAATRGTPERIAIDSAVYWRLRAYLQLLGDLSTLAATIGRLAPPVVGNVWIDTTADDHGDVAPNHDSTGVHRMSIRAESLATGHVTVLDFFQTDFSPTLPAQYGIQRLHVRFGNAVRVIGITSLTGSWGKTFVTPDAEVQQISRLLRQTLRVTFPVALWVMPKAETSEGGFLPPEHPSYAAYRLVIRSPATFVVVDGHGIVRRIFLGGSREVEDDLIRYVETVMRDTQ